MPPTRSAASSARRGLSDLLPLDAAPPFEDASLPLVASRGRGVQRVGREDHGLCGGDPLALPLEGHVDQDEHGKREKYEDRYHDGHLLVNRGTG